LITSPQVSGIASSTTEQQLHDFFSFCGRISKIDLTETGPSKVAVIHFEKPSAAKTALMVRLTLASAQLVLLSIDSDNDNDLA